MRRGDKPKIVTMEDGKVAGVDLSSDFTAEHEWSIQPIRDYFGLEINKVGIEKRIIHNIPKGFMWIETAKEAGFAFVPEWVDDKHGSYAKRIIRHEELQSYSWRKGSDSLRSAWSQDDFAVISNQPEQITQLKEVYDAFMKKDAFIMLGGREIISNAGLLLGILSRIPKATTDEWKRADEEHIKLRKEVEATGIEELLKEKGKRYYALSPKYDKDGSLIFWLNPTEQKKHNHGWMTLQDLVDWSNDTGKVMMKK